MEEKIEQIKENLTKIINGEVSTHYIDDNDSIIFDFQIRGFSEIHIAVTGTMMEQKGVTMITLGLKEKLKNYVIHRVFKEL